MKQETNWRAILAGVWLPALGLAAYALAGSVSLRLFQLSDHGHPGDQPPWYFIRQDYINGLVMGSLGLLCLAIGLLYIRRYPIWAGMLAWQSVTSFGKPAWDAWVIILRCDNVMDPVAATTQWATFDAYLAEPLRWQGFLVTILLAFGIAAASIFLERSRQLAMKGLMKPVGDTRG